VDGRVECRVQRAEWRAVLGLLTMGGAWLEQATSCL
jgi:hypothetical protein